MRSLPLACLLLLTLAWLPAAAEEPATDMNQTENQEEVPEAPHYYHWVDAKGQTHFSDKPPEETHRKAEKEALTPAPKIGSDSNLTNIYRRANSIMETPVTAPAEDRPAAAQGDQPIQPDGPVVTTPPPT